MKVNIKKVGQFLMEINDLDYGYMRLCMNMRDLIQKLINKYGKTKAEIIEIFQLKPAQYKNFITGSYNYSIEDISRINHAIVEAYKTSVEDPIKVTAEYKYSKKSQS